MEQQTQQQTEDKESEGKIELFIFRFSLYFIRCYAIQRIETKNMIFSSIPGGINVRVSFFFNKSILKYGFREKKL